MEPYVNGADTSYGEDELRKADIYACPHEDCDTFTITDFGSPYRMHGLGAVIELLDGTDQEPSG